MRIAICSFEITPPTLASLIVSAGGTAETFPADGCGGKLLEQRILANHFDGVLELNLRELAAELLQQPGGAGPDRLTAAAIRRIPQAISLAHCADGLTPEQADALGMDIAQRACASGGPTAILFPPPLTTAERAMHESIRNWAAGIQLLDVERGGLELAAATWLIAKL